MFGKKTAENDGRVSKRVLARVEKERDDLKREIRDLTAMIGRLNRKNAELVDQVELRDLRLKTMAETVEMARASVASWTAILERRRLDSMAGLTVEDG